MSVQSGARERERETGEKREYSKNRSHATAWASIDAVANWAAAARHISAKLPNFHKYSIRNEFEFGTTTIRALVLLRSVDFDLCSVC